MKYRYYYNAQGIIIGFTQYKNICLSQGIGDSTGYIDSDERITIEDYRVDLTTQTLVDVNQ